jgi:hypothetical protein
MLVAKEIWPHNTAAQVEAHWVPDKSTAKNVAKGVAGGLVAIHAVQAQQRRHRNGWALWRALGELIIGEPEEAYDARVLQQMVEETDRARQARERRLAARRRLEESAAHRFGLDYGAGDHAGQRQVGGDGSGDDGVGGGPLSGAASEVDDELFDPVQNGRPVEGKSYAPKERGRS